MNEAIANFHRRTAEELAGFYAGGEGAPDGWRETLAWHWEQGSAYAEAADAALEVAEYRVAMLDFAEARVWAERVLALLDRLDDLERRAYELRAYALTIAVLEFAGQYREGLGYARLLLRLAEERGKPDALGRAHLTIGRMQRELGQLAVAEAEILRALALAQQSEQSELESDVRFQLAKVHQLQGRHLEALQQLQLAQEELPTDDQARLARVCTGIGDVYRVVGAGREALRLYNRALKLEIGGSNRIGQAMLYEKLGLSQMELGQVGEALDCVRESLSLRISLEDLVGQARAQSILGTIQSKLHNHEAALKHFLQARELEEQLQNRRGMVIALSNIGDVARAMGDDERAQASFVEALALAGNANDQIGLARIYQRMGDMSYDQQARDVAHDHWNEALRIRQALGHSEEVIALQGRLNAGLPGRRQY